MSIYSAFCHKEVYSSSWSYKNPKCSGRKKDSQDLQNFYNKNDSKVI